MKTKILLIEPDSLLANLYKVYLEKNDYSVSLALSGQGAIDLMETTIPDLIILEIQLSSHNGYEFLYELRSYMEWVQIPVIVNSFVAFDPSGSRREILEQLGVLAYLYKPTTSFGRLKYYIEDSLLVSKK